MSSLINFSVIIPHKNIPDLLQRCLNSIPVVDDLEIIIVDDNSSKIHKNEFPGLNRKNTSIIFSDRSLTAGGARNLGLTHSVGKWIIFADADDFFHDGFYPFISKFKESEHDLIYFGMDSVYSDSLKPAYRAADIVRKLSEAASGEIDSIDYVRYKFLYPSCKIINRNLIDKFQIRFDEVPASNDTMFGVKVATFAEKIIFDSQVLYCLTYRENSLVTSFKYKFLKSRLMVAFDLYNHLEYYGKEKYAQSILSHWWKLRKISYWKLISTLGLLLRNYKLRALIGDIKYAISNRINKK